jgi:putative ABC transport system permease protein
MTNFPVSPRLLGALAFFILAIVALAIFGKVPITYNLRNLIVRWPVTILTALAFTLVVGLMTVMLAFVNGMYELTKGSVVPGNVIVMSDGALDEQFSNLGYRDTGELDHHSRNVLRDDENRPLASWELYLIVNQPIPRTSFTEKTGRKRRFLAVRGIIDPVISGRVHRLDLHPGGAWFSASGVRHATGENGETLHVVEAVLGEGIAREFGHDYGKKTLEVGDLFDVGPRKWVVSGIMKSAGSTFDSEIWAKHQICGQAFGKEGTSTTLVLQTKDLETARETAKDYTQNYKKSAVQAQTETEYYEKLNGTNKQFLVAIIFVAIIMAIGGIFGVMNTMFAAISQRIKDIGVLRILGFAPWQLLLSFFLESLLLAFIGGAIGCALGSLANGLTASSIVGSGSGGGKSVVLKLTVDSNIVLLGLLFSLCMGAVGGFLPSFWAMRLKALDSLR